MILMLGSSSLFPQSLTTCKSERDLAAKKVRQIINEWPIRKNDSVTDYIRALGNRIATEALGDENINWRFNVILDRSPNAFAVGDGYIFITEGAVTICQNEAELAAILAHEIGHQLAGHFCQNNPRQRQVPLADQFSRFKSYTDRKKSIGSLTQIIDIRKETQADRIAVQLLSSAGYDPHAMLQVAKRLPSQDGSFSYAGNQQRIYSLDSILAHTPRLQSRSSGQFEKIKQDLIKQDL
jgi:predicted Zn-dependent protease